MEEKEKKLTLPKNSSRESHTGILRDTSCVRSQNPFGYHTAGESDFGVDEDILVYHEAYDCDFNVISEILSSD